MTDILQLPGWEVSKTYEDATEGTIEASFTEPADACQKCGVIGALYKPNKGICAIPFSSKTN